MIKSQYNVQATATIPTRPSAAPEESASIRRPSCRKEANRVTAGQQLGVAFDCSLNAMEMMHSSQAD